MLAAGIAALAVTGLAVWTLTRDGGTGPDEGTLVVATGESQPTSVATTTSAPDSTDTLVITVPESTAGSVTLPDASTPLTAAPGDRLVDDDTGFFTVAVPNDFQVDSQAVSAGSVVVPSVKASTDLVAFANDYVTVGYLVRAFPNEVTTSPQDGIGLVSPGDQDCASVNADTDIDTGVGPAVLQTFEGCGPEGGTVAVVALLDGGSGRVFVVYAQGSSTADSVTELARTVLESISIN